MNDDTVVNMYKDVRIVLEKHKVFDEEEYLVDDILTVVMKHYKRGYNNGVDAMHRKTETLIRDIYE